MLAALGLFASGWPEYIRLHPSIPLSFFAVGIGLVVLGLFSRKKPEVQPVSSFSKSETGHIHIEVNPVFNNAPYIGQSASPVQANSQEATSVQSPAPIKSPARKAGWNPLGHAPEVHVLSFESGKWQPSKTGIRCAIVWFSNEPPPSGGNTEPFRLLFVTLVYKEKEKVLAHVDRAYWLNENAGQIDLDRGQRRGIVLGAFHCREWRVFQNPVTRLRRPSLNAMRSATMPIEFPPPQEYSFVFDSLMEIDVFLISAHTGETIKKCEISVRDVGQETFDVGLKQSLYEA
jgi:hypothetical protein